MDHDAALQLEQWTLTITKVTDDKKSFDYDVEGSKTGPDGHGSNQAAFRSNSCRAIINQSWFFKGFGDITPGYKITWEVLPFFQDRYVAPAQVDATRESAVCVAQGLPNTRHTLTLKSAAGKSIPLSAICAYCPLER